MTKLKWETSFSGMAPEFSGRPEKPLLRSKRAKVITGLSPLEIAERSFAYWDRKAKALRSVSQDDTEALRIAFKFRARIEMLKNANRT